MVSDLTRALFHATLPKWTPGEAKVCFSKVQGIQSLVCSLPQTSVSWTPWFDGYSSCNQMHIPQSPSWWGIGFSKALFLVGYSITWRRKLLLMHSRNLQQTWEQVSPLGQLNASPSKKHPAPCMSSWANCPTMLWLTCQVLFAHSVPCAPQGCSLWALEVTPFLLAPHTPYQPHTWELPLPCRSQRCLGFP